MTIDELGDLVGTSVTLNTSISNRRYRANIIGYNVGRGLIITPPVALWGDVDLQVGEEVVVRFLANEKAFAFKAGVVHMAFIPYQHMHLTYPRKLQFENYRNYIRLKTKELAARLLIPESGFMDVIVIDVSMGGLQLLCRSPELAEDMELTIEFVLPQQLNNVSIVLPVAIRNRKPSEQGFDCYGLEFVRLQPDDISRLQQLLGYCVSTPANALPVIAQA